MENLIKTGQSTEEAGASDRFRLPAKLLLALTMLGFSCRLVVASIHSINDPRP